MTGTKTNLATRLRRDKDTPITFWQIAKRTWKEQDRDNIGLIAAGVAFYSFLAFVPLIAATVLIYGLVADGAMVMEHSRVAFDLMPADAASILTEQMSKVALDSQKAQGWGLILTLTITLYGAMRGATATITALNIVFELHDGRNFFQKLLLAAAITLSMVGVAIFGIVAIAALAFLESLLPSFPYWAIFLIRVAFWLTAAFVAASGIALIYKYGPNYRQGRWKELLPGAVFATFGWLGVTLGFGAYVANFADYNATYGALGAVVVLLMWLFLSAYVLLLGAELNAVLIDADQEGREVVAG
ncbi:MAG: YihY/virulence factor BrkB family protein [Pacificimonas sp.]